MTEEQRALLTLSLIPNIGPVAIRQLISHFGSAQQILKSPKSKLSKVQGIGEKLSSAINGVVLQNETERILEQNQKHQIETIFYNSEEYPQKLNRVSDAPIVLYKRGGIDLNPQKTIGIVGTRRATRYGKKITSEIVQESLCSHPCVISGLAFGIDVKAHESALENNLSTIAVMACGVDTIYPASHKNIGMKIIENGAVISEYPVGTKADPRFFPARNRILAALCDALIVVQAAKTGGALITANMAHDYNRPVFAVPGELHSTYSEGCNLLIKRMKASIYTGFEDVVRELNWDLAKESRQQELFTEMASLKGMEKKVIQVLMNNDQQMHIDQLAWQTNFSLSELAGLLLQLEFKGLIKPMPGKEYRVV